MLMPCGSGNQQRESARSFPIVRANSRLRELNTQANSLFAARRYSEAAGINRLAYESAMAENAPGAATRFLLNLAGCSFGLMKYGDALDAYVRARGLAESAGDWEAAATASLNLSSLHLQLSEMDGAREEARRGLSLLEARPNPALHALFSFQLAKIEAVVSGIDAALPAFAGAIAEAEAEGNTRLSAQVWNYQGYLLMNAGRLDAADASMANAFRLRKLASSPDLEGSYRTLSMLRLAQGDVPAAEALAGRAVEAAARNPNWMAYFCRGRARAAAGRPDEAVADFRTAASLARRFRLDLAPSDAHRIGADANLDDLYSAYAETAASQYLRTRDAAYAAEGFRAVENGRAASLRALVATSGRYQRSSPEYGELLARLRATESALVGRPIPELHAEARRLRYEMALAEARAGIRTAASGDDGDLDIKVQRALRRGQALLSVRTGDAASYMWAVTRHSIEVHRLPGRRELAASLAAFARSIRNGGRGGEAARVYEMLFGKLSRRVLDSAAWAFSLDEELLQAPLAAAEMPGGARLGERYALATVPCAHFLLEPRRAAPSGKFVAVGDAIYNRADPRAKGLIKAQPAVEFPRLAGSAAEIRAAAAAWGASDPALLEGTAAASASLAAAPAPEILHFATHFLVSERGPARADIVLSLQPDGKPDLLTPADVAAWPRAPELVVLSGCSSGRGEVRRGAGLLGLTRAWIAAGAGSVVASLWPAPDSTGEFFSSFYLRLRAGDAPAEALRRARLDAARSGRIPLRDWAAYVVIGRG